MSRAVLSIVSFAFLAIVASGVLTACSTSGSGSGEHSISVLRGPWELLSIDGADVGPTLPEGARRPNLTIREDGRVAGFGGVNRVSGQLDLVGISSGVFKLGPMVSTKMAGPPALMSLEDRFMRDLAEARTYTVTDGILVISDASNTPRLRFVRAS